MSKLSFCVMVILMLLFRNGLIHAEGEKGKFLVILQAGKESHEGMARALHALLYSKELLENGYGVVLVFDGAGTEWIHEWTNPGSTDKLLRMYKELQQGGITEIICDYCSYAFHAKEDLKERNIPITNEYQGHPSITKWVNQGYQVLIL